MKNFNTILIALGCAVLPALAQEEPAAPAPAAPAPAAPAPAAPAPAAPAPAAPAPATPAPAAPALVLEWNDTKPLQLAGPHARHQLVLAARESLGTRRDISHEAEFKSEPEGIVQIESSGLVRALRDGAATITARFQGAQSPPLAVTVNRFTEIIPISFPNEIGPVLTRHGCNSGGCHGKSEGQNGFRLSLLGYEPWNDHEYLVKESRGRRIFRAAPDHSLLLLKASGELPHQGGSRIDRDSDDYKLLVRWINQGLSYGPKDDPSVERIEVSPRECLTRSKATQQLQVTAHFSDGTKSDVTRAVQFEANDEEMAEVNENGRVTMNDRPGSTSVMIRFQEHVDVFRATIPLGAPVGTFPDPANFIDERIFAKLETLGLPPSGPCDDPTFLRRVTIDIAGRLPSLQETDAFLAEPDPAKRSRRIDELLASSDHADYFAGKWAAILRNKRKAPHHARGSYAFHSWIRDAIHANRPYNLVVKDLVSASGEAGRNPPVIWYRTVTDRKEQLQDVAQIFLGIRLQCAQCHHHPYEKWSQDDYYGFEAFFSTVARKPGDQPGEELIYHKRGPASAQNPRTGKSLKPTPLGEKELALAPHQDPRSALADWMVDDSNPFLAKMLVNRYWKHFFGRGLVDPEDDLRVTNPPTHPKLLDDLAGHFVASGYDMKDIVRKICNSRTYQLSAIPNDYNLVDRQNCSRFYPRRLPAEVLLDAINLVTDSKDKFGGQPLGVKAVQLPDDLFTRESYFLSVFGRPDMNSACECERADDVNLAQALHLVNSKNIRNKLASDKARAFQLVSNRERTDEDRIAELYRRALSRPPIPEETTAALEHLKTQRTHAAAANAEIEKKNADIKEEAKKGKTRSPEQIERAGFEDIIWALLNTKEFLFNH